MDPRTWWRSDAGTDARTAGDVSGIVYMFAVHVMTDTSIDVIRLLNHMIWDARIGPLDAAAIMCTLVHVSGARVYDAHIGIVDYLRAAFGRSNVDFTSIPRRIDLDMVDLVDAMTEGAAKKLQGVVREWLKRHRAASKIGSTWKRAISDPSYSVCRQRLIREFGDGTIM